MLGIVARFGHEINFAPESSIEKDLAPIVGYFWLSKEEKEGGGENKLCCCSHSTGKTAIHQIQKVCRQRLF
jgi:hypothetical protein